MGPKVSSPLLCQENGNWAGGVWWMLVIQVQDAGPGRHRPHQVSSLLLSSRAFCWMQMLPFGRDVVTLVEGG